MSTVAPRVVVVSRPSELESLVARHGTRAQASFFLERRGQSLRDVEERHLRIRATLEQVMRAIPLSWRRSHVTRADLPRWVFEPGDVVVAVGQDGLVPNVAKYLDGQTVIGVNPDPATFDGVLVRHRADRVGAALRDAVAGTLKVEERTMAEASLDDGQRLLALNEVFVGQRTHQSARYRVRAETREERHSSSGVVVATGTGATGWARSICLQRKSPVPLPAPSDRTLAFLVREAFPSVATGVTLTEGIVAEGAALEVVSEMNEGGVVFADGIEDDRIELGWGMRATVRVARERLHLAA